MYLKANKKSERFNLFFIFAVFFFTIFGFEYQWPFLNQFVDIITKYKAAPIGYEFRWASFYLRRVPWAGYMTCVESADPSIDVNVMGPYQEAQFVLSPTILDNFHPLNYQYVIYQCPQEDQINSVPKELSHYTRLNNLYGVTLFHRRDKF